MLASSAAMRQALRAYFYVGVWMTVSISVILFNKWLLAFAGFPFPITLTLWHMIVCSIAGFLCVRVFKTSKSFNMSVEDYVRRVLPIGAPLRLPRSDSRVRHPATLAHARACSLWTCSFVRLWCCH